VLPQAIKLPIPGLHLVPWTEALPPLLEREGPSIQLLPQLGLEGSNAPAVHGLG
jgi:hypothetical protein